MKQHPHFQAFGMILFMSLAVVSVVVLMSAAHCQSISPVTFECGKKCSGEFTIANQSFQPMVVVVQSYSFSMNGHLPVLRKLDPGVTIHLSEQSTKIRAKDQHFFDYKIDCTSEVCPVMFYALMSTGKPNANGVTLRLALPHAVYICADKAKDCRSRALKGMGATP